MEHYPIVSASIMIQWRYLNHPPTIIHNICTKLCLILHKFLDDGQVQREVLPMVVCCVTQRQHSKCWQSLAEFPMPVVYCNLCCFSHPLSFTKCDAVQKCSFFSCMCLAVL
jgi:hypothetical protein